MKHAAQLAAVKALMWNRRWHTLRWLASVVGAPEQSVSARLRDLRKRRFGGHRVDRRLRAGEARVYEYRLRTKG